MTKNTPRNPTTKHELEMALEAANRRLAMRLDLVRRLEIRLRAHHEGKDPSRANCDICNVEILNHRKVTSSSYLSFPEETATLAGLLLRERTRADACVEFLYQLATNASTPANVRTSLSDFLELYGLDPAD